MGNFIHSIQHDVRFGDCDPAGIVFYPRFFGWFDRCFHDWLWTFGGHAGLCTRLDLVGIGLMGADAAFRSPARDGDTLEITMKVAGWSARSLSLEYEIRSTDLVATGHEVRGLFMQTETGIKAGEMQRLRDVIDG